MCYDIYTMLLNEIAKLLACDAAMPALSVHQVCIDSRQVQPGDLFVAIKGPNFDGHQFIQQVKAKGAIAAVVSEKIADDLPQIIVADTIKALGEIAKFHRAHFNCNFIALTGSCGKTTTKTLIAEILQQQAPTL